MNTCNTVAPKPERTLPSVTDRLLDRVEAAQSAGRLARANMMLWAAWDSFDEPILGHQPPWLSSAIRLFKVDGDDA